MHTLITAVLVLLPGATGCKSTQSEPAPGPVTFRVMTYNIHHGRGTDDKVDLQRIADVIQREQADIVALQEVDKGVARTGRRDLTAELAQLTGMTGIFSNNFHYQGGEYGNAVLTRFPVLNWTNHHYQMIREGEQRGLLQLVLDVHGHELVFMNTHIDYRGDDTERLMNVEEIKKAAAAPVSLSSGRRREERAGERRRPLSPTLSPLACRAIALRRLVPRGERKPKEAPAHGEGSGVRGETNRGSSPTPRPTIICGDFNALPGSRTHERMKGQFRDAWEEAGTGDGFTFPSTGPVRRIDYIWLSKDDSLRPLKLWVPETEASDHLPVVAEIELR